MKRPKIKTSLIATLITVGVCLAAFAGYAVTEISTINLRVQGIFSQTLPMVQYSEDIAADLSALEISYKAHLLTGDTEAGKATEGRIAQQKEHFLKDLTGHRALFDDAQTQALLGRIEAQFTQYTTQGEQLLALSRDGKTAEALKLEGDAMAPVVHAVM